MNQIAENLDMQALIHQIRDQIQLCQTADCEQRIAQAMQQYPHSPVPHNLMGILLSQQNEPLRPPPRWSRLISPPDAIWSCVPP